MRIAWLQDLNIFSENVGGAERSDRAAVKEGLRRVHEITLVNADDLRSVGIANFDFMVVSNAVTFNQSEILRAAQVLPYIMYIHDYYPLCKWRLFYPALEKCKKCSNMPQAKQLLLNSMLNIFLSPRHFDTWCKAIPELREHPYFLHPSPVDTKLFKPYDGVSRKKNSVLGVNSLLKFKGAENVIEYAEQHPELTFTFVGAKDDSLVLPKNCYHLGYVANSTLPEMLTQAEYFVHLPSYIDPCSRAIIEAKLSGCKLIINQNVGIASYDEFRLPRDEFAKWISGAATRFWQKIEEKVKA